jgi:hypothetical protein
MLGGVEAIHRSHALLLDPRLRVRKHEELVRSPKTGLERHNHQAVTRIGVGHFLACGAQAAALPISAPQCLHRLAAGFRSSERHAGQVFVGGGSPKTVFPRRAMTTL